MGKTRTKKTVEKPAHERMEDALKAQFPDVFEPELIGGVDVAEAAKDVLLSVAYTPVIPDRDGFVPCSVIELDPDEVNGTYRLYFPAHFEDHRASTTQDVSADLLRVMRARYILTKNYLQAHFDQLPYDAQNRAMRLFFDGRRPFVPLAGSRLADIPTEGLSIELKPGQTHADLIAELFAEAGEKNPSVVVLGENPQETAKKLGFVCTACDGTGRDDHAPAHEDAECKTCHGETDASPAPEPPPAPPTKPTGYPVEKKRAKKQPKQDTLPIAEAFYSVAELPPTTAPSPNPALRAAEGMTRAVFAVWYTSHKPDLAALEPPDELGCFVGAQCAVEATTTADRLIRERKGPRSFAWPLSPEFAKRVYTDGIRQRTTGLQVSGRKAMGILGFPDDTKLHATQTDKDIQQAYRRIVSERRLHPDQGGDRDEFERITAARDSAIEYVRSLGEAYGRAGQSNEEREAGSNIAGHTREFFLQWARDQRGKDIQTKPHMTVAANAQMLAILRILVKHGFARIFQEGETGESHVYALTIEGMQEAEAIEKKTAEKAAAKTGKTAKPKKAKATE